MIAKKSQKFAFLRKNWAYLLIFAVIIAVAFFGSMNKSEYSDDTMNMQSIVSGNSQLSADRVGEFYLVAELADSMNLESSGLTDVNYSSIVQLYQNGQVADDTGKLNKPVTVNIASVSRGVIQYIVKEGETLQTIAARFGLTMDQIRWSNNLSTQILTQAKIYYFHQLLELLTRLKTEIRLNLLPRSMAPLLKLSSQLMI